VSGQLAQRALGLAVARADLVYWDHYHQPAPDRIATIDRHLGGLRPCHGLHRTVVFPGQPQHASGDGLDTAERPGDLDRTWHSAGDMLSSRCDFRPADATYPGHARVPPRRFPWLSEGGRNVSAADRDRRHRFLGSD